MATVFNTGTATRPASYSQREDLANFISNIVRDDIPFMSSIGKGKAKAVNHEWSTDTLERPGANAQVEGAAYATPVNAPEVQRIGNYTQIFNKRIEVTGTIETVDKAGRKSEFKYQSEKRGKELMRDVEYALVTAKNVKASGQTRTMAGYQAWVPTVNTVDAGASAAQFPLETQIGSTAENDVIPGGLGTTTFKVADTTTDNVVNRRVEDTTPTTGAFSLSQVDDVMQQVWQNGGKPNTLMMSPRLKRAFSVAAQGQINVSGETANVRRNIDDKGSLRQSVEMYESDFGLVKVVPNYIMAATDVGTGATDVASTLDNNILVYDASSFKMATLRPLHHRDISEDGDKLRAMMVQETTLECMNPLAVGLITNITA